MNSLFVALLLTLVTLVFSKRAIDLKLIQHLNSKPKNWIAGPNKFFVGMQQAEVPKLLGWDKEAERKLRKVSKVVSYSGADVQGIPATFTSSVNWPKCPTIGHIFNQADCGSCWAFGAIESASDRKCIATNGQWTAALSFADLLECGGAGGCNGGSGGAAWNSLVRNGVVTDACYPYYIPTCPPQDQPCLNFVPTPACWSNQSCVNGASWTSYQADTAYYVSEDVASIQKEIMTYGPVEACFTVYKDFVHYKSGVYKHTSGGPLGGHCVKISGWGTENGEPYWLVNNSWTTTWGLKGYFKILRGVDECGIESDIIAGRFSS